MSSENIQKRPTLSLKRKSKTELMKAVRAAKQRKVDLRNQYQTLQKQLGLAKTRTQKIETQDHIDMFINAHKDMDFRPDKPARPSLTDQIQQRDAFTNTSGQKIVNPLSDLIKKQRKRKYPHILYSEDFQI